MGRVARPGFRASLRRDVGIDLGTANTLVHLRGHGVIVREPSVIAIDRATGEVLAVGTEAKRMLGRNPDEIRVVRPLRSGVIADFEQGEAMLRHFLGKAGRGFFLQRNVVVGVPCGVTEVERMAVVEATLSAGATRAFVLPEPLAAAIGAGLPVDDPGATLVVDVGGGTTEIAIISLGGIVHARSLRVAGDEMDAAIAASVRRSHGLHIGEKTSEAVKTEIGSAIPRDIETAVLVKGRDVVTGLPRAVELSEREVREALADVLGEIVGHVKTALELAPPELAADALDRGIVLTGGGSLLRGFAEYVTEQTGVPAALADEPLDCVAKGTGIVVERMHRSPALREMLERATDG